MNCWSYLRGLAFLSSSTGHGNCCTQCLLNYSLQHYQLTLVGEANAPCSGSLRCKMSKSSAFLLIEFLGAAALPWGIEHSF